MTTYVFLLQVENYTLSASDENSLIRITLTGCGMSLVGCMLTLFLICFLPVCTDGMFIIGNMVVSLLGAQATLMGLENTYPARIFCRLATAAAHNLFLSLHFWALTYGIHLCIKMKNIGRHKPKLVRRMFYFMIGWLTPIVIVSITTIIRGESLGYTHNCWLTQKHGLRWAFVGPVIVILLINTAILCMMLRVHYVMDTKRNLRLLYKVRNVCKAAVSLIPVLGLTWYIGLIPLSSKTIGFQYLFVAINSFQGFLIFICHMTSNIQVKHLWHATSNITRDADADIHQMNPVISEISDEVRTGSSQTGDGKNEANGNMTHA